jgi:tetratricopeptide (TPR) repeat protein
MARAYFIYGCPGETWDTIQDTIDLIHEIKPLSIIFYILDIFPGTALYSDFKKRCKITDNVWLKRIEDIIYFQSDPDLSQDIILAFGQKLRMDYYENLAGFTCGIEVIDDKELYEMHADFFSRLGMTFDYGDYANIEVIKDKDKVAERLYKKSLSYYPDHRAFLGLGIIKQKTGEYIQSAKILSEGVEYFPESEQLNICLGISYMNLREYNKALPYFLKFKDSKEANYYIAACNEALEA